jgi:hypothetical protein
MEVLTNFESDTRCSEMVSSPSTPIIGLILEE